MKFKRKINKKWDLGAIYCQHRSNLESEYKGENTLNEFPELRIQFPEIFISKILKHLYSE